MIAYIGRRIALMIPVVILVSIMVFVLIRAIPGDAVTLMLQDSGGKDAAALRAKLGLDRPVALQYLYWMRDAARGDLGQSFYSKKSVIGEIRRALPVTIELAILSMVVAVLIGIPIGLISAVWQNTIGDYIARVIGIAGLSIPAFWLGTLYIMLPSLWFHWLPPTTYVPFFSDPLQNIKQFILPALALGYYLSAISMRMMRSQTLEVLRQDYIRTARAKGVSDRVVVLRHALRNALIPVVTIVGSQMGVLIGGAVIIEQIFLLPGLGRLTLSSISVRDYPQIQANIVVIVLLTLLINLLTDLSYAWLDPRIRY